MVIYNMLYMTLTAGEIITDPSKTYCKYAKMYIQINLHIYILNKKYLRLYFVQKCAKVEL